MTDDPHDVLVDDAAAAKADQRKKLEDKAADFDAIRKAVDDAGSFVRGLWVTYVTLGTYIVVAVASVTHRQLFLEIPIKLPLLDVQLPLVAFFMVAPWFFLVFHFYLLIQLTLLAGKIAQYNASLWETLPEAPKDAPEYQRRAAEADGALRRRLRQQLPNDILVQFLAGPRDTRERGLGAMLRLIARMTMVFGALIVLLLVQFRFLPYQDEITTWTQRAAVLVDLLLLWAFWPAIASGRGALYWSISWKGAAGALACVCVAAFSLFALTFPREFMDDTRPARAFHDVMVWPIKASKDAESRPEHWEENERLEVKGACKAQAGAAGDAGALEAAVADGEAKSCWKDKSILRRLFGTHVEWKAAASEVESMWLSRVPAARRVIPAALRLRDESFVDDEKVAKIEKRGQDLKLKPAQGERTLRVGPRNFVAADFSSVDLRRSDLRGVRFDDAMMRDIRLDGARLDDMRAENAEMWRAGLEGASLVRAQLQGASLDGAQLQGASLDGAQLQGASLHSAELQDASLLEAQLQGASLVVAQLQGAWLGEAQLQGAWLDEAQLQGASLNGAQLQGASLVGAEFQGASLKDTIVFRVEKVPEPGDSTGLPNWYRITPGDFPSPLRVFDDADVEIWRKAWRDAVGERANSAGGKHVDARFDRLLKNGVSAEEDELIAARWKAFAEQPLDEKRFAQDLVATVCARDGAPFVARRVMGFDHARRHVAEAMRAGRKDPAKCLGVVGFSDEDWNRLDALSKRDNGEAGTASPARAKASP